MYHSSLTRDDVKRGRNALIHGTRLPEGKSGEMQYVGGT